MIKWTSQQMIKSQMHKSQIRKLRVEVEERGMGWDYDG